MHWDFFTEAFDWGVCTGPIGLREVWKQPQWHRLQFGSTEPSPNPWLHWRNEQRVKHRAPDLHRERTPLFPPALHDWYRIKPKNMQVPVTDVSSRRHQRGHLLNMPGELNPSLCRCSQRTICLKFFRQFYCATMMDIHQSSNIFIWKKNLSPRCLPANSGAQPRTQATWISAQAPPATAHSASLSSLCG